MRRADGHADQGPWRRSRLLGDRCALDRSAPVANRRLAPARNSRDDAKEVRLRLARRCRRTGEIIDLRRPQCAALRYPATTLDAWHHKGPHRIDESGILEGRAQ